MAHPAAPYGTGYADVVQAVRRYRPSALLPALARLSARMERRRAEAGRPRRGLLPLWVMEALASESIVHGTEFNRRELVRDVDLQRLGNLYWRSDRVVPDATAAAVMTPILHEQFTSQQSEYEELCRAKVLLGDDCPEDDPLDWSAVFGFDLLQALRSALLLGALVTTQDGRLDWQAVADPADAAAVEWMVSVPQLRQVADYLTATVPVARGEAETGGHTAATHARWVFNPLARYPLIDLGHAGVWAPVTNLLTTAFAPRNLYFAGFRRWGAVFPHRLGTRLEGYVGRQFRLVAGGQLQGKVLYRRHKAEAESVDWIWVHPDAVVLIEVKSARLTGDALAGLDLATTTARYLTKARSQIDETADRIRVCHPAFAHIPADRPIIGLAVTGEPFYLANSTLPEYGAPSRTPSMVLAVREVELLVGAPDASADSVVQHLLRVVLDPLLRTQVFSTTLPNRLGEIRNPILDEAWEMIAPGVSDAAGLVDRPNGAVPPR